LPKSKDKNSLSTGTVITGTWLDEHTWKDKYGTVYGADSFLTQAAQFAQAALNPAEANPQMLADRFTGGDVDLANKGIAASSQAITADFSYAQAAIDHGLVGPNNPFWNDLNQNQRDAISPSLPVGTVNTTQAAMIVPQAIAKTLPDTAKPIAPNSISSRVLDAGPVPQAPAAPALPQPNFSPIPAPTSFPSFNFTAAPTPTQAPTPMPAMTPFVDSLSVIGAPIFHNIPAPMPPQPVPTMEGGGSKLIAPTPKPVEKAPGILPPIIAPIVTAIPFPSLTGPRAYQGDAPIKSNAIPAPAATPATSGIIAAISTAVAKIVTPATPASTAAPKSGILGLLSSSLATATNRK
jgi:hypothetical protein